MEFPRRTFLHLAAGVTALPAVTRLAWAQAYPARAATLIVPFAAGGATDVGARVAAEHISRTLGQQVGLHVWCHSLRHTSITQAVELGQRAGLGLDKIRAHSRHRTIATVRVGRQPYAVAFAAGSVWVTNSDDGTVARIDPSTNKVVARIRVARNPYGIAARSRSLWVASLGAGTISSLEASSGRVVKTIRVGGDPVGVALTSGGIWFSQNSEGAVTRLSNQNGHASKAS